MSEKKRKKEMWFEWKWNDVLDLPSLEIVSFGGCSFKCCHVAVFESMWWLFIFISLIFLDLPKLHTILFNDGWALQGDDRDNRKTIINGHESYDNTLIMKSKLKRNEIRIVLCCDDNCLDLPSLTEIKGNDSIIHRYMGYVILESMIWFDLIWFDFFRHSKSHWKQHSVWRRCILLYCWFASNKYSLVLLFVLF